MSKTFSSQLFNSSRISAHLIVVALCLDFWRGTAAVLASTAQGAPDLCIAAAENAANQTGVPLPVLLAITLVETGKSGRNGVEPWPWAINQAGQGHWFPTADDAIKYAESQLDLGQRNFDVGCFQINHRWHSKGFRSTSDMFDPTSNALYAAQFLSKIYSELGDWSLSAATYHSRTPELADRYRAKFEATLAGLTNPTSVENLAAPLIPRINQFPLLQAGSPGKVGSLVPLISTGIRLIGNQP